MKATRQLAIRFTEEDREVIERLSLKEGMGASTWIRKTVLSYLVKIKKKKKSLHPIQERSR